MTQSGHNLDQQLLAALTPSVRPSDGDFAARVKLAIDEAHRYAAQRRRSWTRFGVEVASAASVGAGLWLFSRMPALAPFVDQGGMLPIASPLVLVMLLWAGTYRWRLD
jgi:hypothetical protein